jgi:hypothetical protein
VRRKKRSNRKERKKNDLEDNADIITVGEQNAG